MSPTLDAKKVLSKAKKELAAAKKQLAKVTKEAGKLKAAAKAQGKKAAAKEKALAANVKKLANDLKQVITASPFSVTGSGAAQAKVLQIDTEVAARLSAGGPKMDPVLRQKILDLIRKTHKDMQVAWDKGTTELRVLLAPYETPAELAEYSFKMTTGKQAGQLKLFVCYTGAKRSYVKAKTPVGQFGLHS